MIPESAKEAPGRIDGVPSNLSPRTRPSGRLAMDEVPINPAPASKMWVMKAAPPPAICGSILAPQ